MGNGFLRLGININYLKMLIYFKRTQATSPPVTGTLSVDLIL